MLVAFVLLARLDMLISFERCDAYAWRLAITHAIASLRDTFKMLVKRCPDPMSFRTSSFDRPNPSPEPRVAWFAGVA